MATLKKNPDYSTALTLEAVGRNFFLLTEELSYILCNLSPEENFTEAERSRNESIYERLTAIEKRLDQLEAQ